MRKNFKLSKVRRLPVCDECVPPSNGLGSSGSSGGERYRITRTPRNRLKTTCKAGHGHTHLILQLESALV